MEDRGIVIYALKKPAYGKFAYNLAVSIKHHTPNLKVCTIVDGDLSLSHLRDDQKQVFDFIIKMDEADCNHSGKFSPGKAKLSGYKYFPFERTMIIDGDSICVSDLNSLFDKCTKNVHSQVCSAYTEKDQTWQCQWMPLDAVKECFALPESYNLYEINSSFMYVKKSEQAEAFYKAALNNFLTKDSHPKLRTWGGGFPDELAFNVAFAQCGIDPSFEHQTTLSNETQWPIFFSTRFTNTWNFVFDNYHFIGYYGDSRFTDRSLQEQYDRLMRAYLLPKAQTHMFKISQLMKEKHVLTK